MEKLHIAIFEKEVAEGKEILCCRFHLVNQRQTKLYFALGMMREAFLPHY